MNAIIDRIVANPNPRSWKVRILQSIAWGRSLNREAAFDSARNVLCYIGAGTMLANIGTMRLWLLAPAVLFSLFVWYLDYLRHF